MIELKNVPVGYDYCFAGIGRCPKASTCLRAIAAQLLSESEEPQPKSVNVVNPLYVERLPDLSACEAALHRAPPGDGMLLLRTLFLPLTQGRKADYAC